MKLMVVYCWDGVGVDVKSSNDGEGSGAVNSDEAGMAGMAVFQVMVTVLCCDDSGDVQQPQQQ